MKKNNVLNWILIIIVALFAISVVDKSFQNDTFFDIPIGKYIIENGIDMMDHFTWHTELTYTYSHWIFGIVEALLYDSFGFWGIYILVLILSCITAITIYIILDKMVNDKILSFILTMFTIYIGQGAFAARAQVVTFWLFILQFYCIEQLVKTNKNKYGIILFIIPIIIANVHASVWIISFIFYFPYIAEFLIYNILKLLKEKGKIHINVTEKNNKLIIEKNNILKLIRVMILTTVTGLLTPLGDVPYIFLQNNITGLSSQYIAELQPLNIMQTGSILFMVSLYIGIIAFTKTKVKLTDAIYMLGFLLMTLAVYRSIFYLIFIGAFLLGRLLKSLLAEYNVNPFKDFEKLLNKPRNLVLFCFIFLAISAYNILGKIAVQFVDVTSYPIQATEYILKNIDIENMRIYNSFNYGSYLELKGIKAFIDSRSEVYCEEFNDTEILKDVIDVESGKVNYKEIFEKYGITHALILNSNVINVYIAEDNDYKAIYHDDNFVIYEKLN